MGADVEASIVADPTGPHVIHEAPRTHRASLATRQDATDPEPGDLGRATLEHLDLALHGHVTRRRGAGVDRGHRTAHQPQV
jgi:hypothetical protein